MSDKVFGAAFISIVWMLFGALVWHDHQAWAGIFWPMILTGLGLDILEGRGHE